jgi:predicted membrane-bound mannosyltransferase
MNSSTSIDQLKTSFPLERAIAVLLILSGVLLRVRQYLTGRSLWADEAALALNLVNRDFAGMFQPLDYDQGAPIGFLLIEKIFNIILGKNELALRLFPLMIGLISLWLFYLLLKKITRGAGLLTALALFALNPRLIYYSSELKQYILDVVVTILLLLIAVRVFDTSPRKKDFAWLMLAGLIALWFSHPALFVLAGIGIALIIITVKRRDYSNLRFVIGTGLLWVLETVFLYLLILKSLGQNAYLREYWQGAFLPMPPWRTRWQDATSRFASSLGFLCCLFVF